MKKVVITLILILSVVGIFAIAFSASNEIDAAEYLAENGYIVERSSASEYRLSDNVLRQEVIGTAVKLGEIELPENYSCKGYYSDLTSTSPNSWACRALEIAADNEIISRSNERARPEDSITKAEALAIVMSVRDFEIFDAHIDVDSRANDWQFTLIIEAQNNGIIGLDDASNFNPNALATRGETFVWGARVLGAEIEETSETVSSDYLGSYEISDSTHGTDTSVTVSGNTRTMTTNGLPNHETGDFPNSGNPNSISAQDETYTMTTNPTKNSSPEFVQLPGVAINGVFFEPETGEFVECSSGERYKIEAFNDDYNLGFDYNLAHVQPTGAYHYHGVPEELINFLDQGQDPIHVGFAGDGFLIYYSPSGKYSPSYQLSSENRSGSGCTYRNNTVDVVGNPTGLFVSDWEYADGLGNLDECNGTQINGEYAYVITDEYPYISRCLHGDVDSSFSKGGGGGGPGGAGGPPPHHRH